MTGVDSTLHACPGCGAKVIGHKTCGDPTRPGCATTATTVTDEARDRAAHALFRRDNPDRAWRDASQSTRVEYERRAEAALEAAVPYLQPQVDREALKGKLDQLWGWAKAGKQRDPDDPSVEYYLMDVENVDAFTCHVLALLSTEETK